MTNLLHISLSAGVHVTNQIIHLDFSQRSLPPKTFNRFVAAVKKLNDPVALIASTVVNMTTASVHNADVAVVLHSKIIVVTVILLRQTCGA